MKNIIIFSIAMSLVACASRPTRITPPQVVTETNHTNFYVPQLNQRSEITVGSSLLTDGVIEETQQYSIKLMGEANGSLDNGFSTNVKYGSISKKYLLSNNHTAFCDNVKAKSSAIDVFGGSSNACLVDFNNDGKFEKVMFSIYARYFSLDSEVEYQTIKLKPISTMKNKSFRREAIYQGVSNNEVKILFREYKDNYIRNSFSQTITYELDNNGETNITFKGFQAKIHKATGSNLSYTVVSPFSS